MAKDVAASALPSSEGADRFDDIIVTATRREERLQDVPVAVTALTGETLANAGIGNTDTLAQVTPNLNFSRSITQVQLTIRGVGSRASVLGDESNIAFYTDGIYMPRPAGASFDLFEIERVEVLRGPQGTLFGRNATGGLVNIITRDPKFDWSGSAEGRVGSYGERSVRGYLTGPIGENVAFDVAALYSQDDGHVRNLLNGARVGGRKSRAVRGKLLLKPTENWTATLSGSYLNYQDEASLYVTAVNGITSGRTFPGAIIASQPRTTALNVVPFSGNKQQSYYLKNNVDLGVVGLEVTSAYSRNSTSILTDADASVSPAVSSDTRSRDHAFSQEVRLLSQHDGPFQWTAGGFFFTEKAYYDPLLIVTSSVSRSVARNKTTSFAAYAEGTYAITDVLKLTLGGRYSHEKRHFNIAQTAGGNTRSLDANGVIIAGAGGAGPTATFKRFSPRAVLQYSFNDSANVYASYSRGFKSGVFNATGLNGKPVGPEDIDAYEIGMKADLTSWLRVNAAAFYYNYAGLQIGVRNPVTLVNDLVNAAKARIKGLEIESTIRPTSDIQIRLGATFLDPKFRQFLKAIIYTPRPNGAGNIATNDVNVSGNDLIRSARFTLSAGIDWSHEYDWGKVGASANAYHSGKFYWEYSNRIVERPYTTVNAQVFIEPDPHLRLGAWVKNLTNTTYLEYFNTGPTADYGTYNRPRSFGGFARVNF